MESKKIKNFLLDQNFVSGIGNIYASEILYLCKIKPEKKAKYLSKKIVKKYQLIQKKYYYVQLEKEDLV